MPRVRVLMMFKDEPHLLETWVRHHADVFGAENLWLFDNGSTCPVTRAAAEEARALGARVETRFNQPRHFHTKHKLFTGAIQSLDAAADVDLVLALDCDELVAADPDQPLEPAALAAAYEPNRARDSVPTDAAEDRAAALRVSLEPHAIHDALAPHVGARHPLRVGACWNNQPYLPGRFARDPCQRKLFFARGACRSLGIGFHFGTGLEDRPPEWTRLQLIHFHFRPFADMQRAARKKLEPRLDRFDPATLAAYRGHGAHLTRYMLLPGEAAYRALFEEAPYLPVAGVASRFAALGRPWPYGDAGVPEAGAAGAAGA